MTIGTHRARMLLVAGIALGVALRVAAVWVAPRFGYLPDHLDSMAWSSWAWTHGAPAIYDMEPELVPLHQVAIDPNTRLPANYMVFAPHACNYPPFSAWIFWMKGALWRMLDPDVRMIPVPPALREAFERRGLPATVAFPTINTRLTRTVDALPSFAFDVALALGVTALVRRLRPGDAAGAVGFVLVLASPVLVLDAGLWGQSDSWLACMLVWCLGRWLCGRFAAAGALYGLALVTKPQAILVAPVLAYAALAQRYAPGGTWRRAVRALRAVPAALLVVAAVVTPFMVHDARSGAGPWRWLARSYLETIGSDEYAYTTLNAFNLWWLDLVAKRPSAAEWWQLLDSHAPALLGLSKDAAGVLLLVLSLALAAVLCARRLRWSVESCVIFAFAVLLSAFLLPTRVHERYVFYCIPFATVLAVHQRAWWTPWVVVSLVGTAELLSHLWVAPTAGALWVSGIAALAGLCMLPFTWGVLSARRSCGRPRSSAEAPGAAGV